MNPRASACRLALASLLVLLLSCDGPRPREERATNEPAVESTLPVAVIDAGFENKRRYYPKSDIEQLGKLPAGVDIQAWEVGRDEHSSHHVVAVRTGENPHAHLRHELVVMIVSGHGRMLLDREELPVGEGSLLYVPRGTRHAFTNEGDEPAIAYVIYTPPEDGNDYYVRE